MLAKELYDIFLVEYEQLAETLQRKFSVTHPKVFAYWLSEGESEIRKKTGYLKTYKDIPITSATDYKLPANYGYVIKVEHSNGGLIKKNIDEFPMDNSLTGIYGIFFESGRWRIRVSLESSISTIRVYYSVASAFNADAVEYFDGDALYNEIDLPPGAIMVLKDYLLSKVIPDLIPKYNKNLLMLASYVGLNSNTKLGYKMDGVI